MKHDLKDYNCLGELRHINIKGRSIQEVREYLKPGEPFIINDLPQEWKAYEKWNIEYLNNKVGHKTISYVQLDNNNMTSYETKQTTKFSYLIDNLNQILSPELRQKKHQALYLVISRIMSHPNARNIQLPELLPDINLPSFIPIHRLWEINLWIGAGGNKSNLHYDPEENLLVVMTGSKKLVLFQPSYRKFLYQYREKNTNTLQSRVNLFDIDRSLFPEIDHAKYYQTTIYSGETVYIPPGWWHAVESSKELNIAININWLPSANYLFRIGNPAREYILNHSTLLKSILFPYRR